VPIKHQVTGTLDLVGPNCLSVYAFRSATTFGPQIGANVLLLRELVGHSTVAMTSAYVARVVDPVRAIEVLNR
jgi:hypothetical protein